MASFTAHASAEQIVSEIKDDEEDLGEVIALIASQVEKLTGESVDDLRYFVVARGKKSALAAFARFIAAAEAEAR